jgi:putative protease
VVTDKDEGVEFGIDNEYIMSAKDLCSIGFLDKILDAGVEILKIEGRGRSADYVDTTVRCYKEAVESIFNDSYTSDKIEHWADRLSTVYNRGFWDGYYLGRKMGEWNDSYGSKATVKKVFLGRGVKYFNKIKVAEFKMETSNLRIGDKVLITGPTTGVIRTEVEELRVDDQRVEEVGKGFHFSLPVGEIVRPSDKLYKLLPA